MRRAKAGSGFLSNGNAKRLRLINRYGPICRRCLGIFPLQYLERDHIVPLHNGGTSHPSNIQLLCIPCHKEKTIEENRELSAKARKDSLVESMLYKLTRMPK